MTFNSCIIGQNENSERRRQALVLFLQTYGERVEVYVGGWGPAVGIQMNPDHWVCVEDGFSDPCAYLVSKVRRVDK